MNRLPLLLAALAALAADAPRRDSTSAVSPRVPPSVAARPGTQPPGAVVVLETARGRIVIGLDDTAAPRTADNFRRLARQGYYDGTCFHAVFPGCQILGGDPNTKNAEPADDGAGGPGYSLPLERSLLCVRGAVVAARLPDVVNPARESNGSQFLILLSDRPELDREGVTVFGRVLRGLDVAEAIGRLGDRPDLLAGRAGPNPGHRALVGRVYLAPPGLFPQE